MASQHRKRRGIKSQVIVAEYMAANGWPYATDAGPGRPGVDILGVPGLSIEVRARRGLSIPAAMRDAATRPGLPILVHRPDGMGEASIADWPMTVRLADGVLLLRGAGYGDPLIPTPGADSR